jgi:hypothetical protein
MASISEPLDDPASDHTHYRLLVTAGPAYDTSTHKIVQVNGSEELTFESEHLVLSIAVRLKHFTGFPDSSPETCAYFEHPLHKWDQYSIAFSFIPKVDISGSDLVFGNDFDRPIRDRLPPGFNQAFRIVKWWIDPGLDGDVYADKPYLYGPALSSWNVLRIGDKIIEEPEIASKEAWKLPNADSWHETVIEEGGEGTGADVWEEEGIPADSAGRQKHFLTEANRDDFVFEAGRLYQSDFGNQYLDFNDFSLKLPGFTMNIIKYIDKKSHELRYTLKNMKTDEVYACVLFTLLFGDELREYEENHGSSEMNGEVESGRKPEHEPEHEPVPEAVPEPAPNAEDDLD